MYFCVQVDIMKGYGKYEVYADWKAERADFSNEFLRLKEFAYTFTDGNWSLFVNANDTFHAAFDSTQFFQLLNADVNEALCSLKGGFCGVIWNEETHETIVFTDPFSLFPIYYAHDAYKAVFSQSLRRLLASGEVEREIDAQSLLDYFRFEFFMPATTIIRGVKQLEPGQYLRIHEDYFSVNTYFEWNKRFIANFQSVDEVYAHVEKLLPKSKSSSFIEPERFSDYSHLVRQLDVPIDTAVTMDVNQLGLAEVFGAKTVFEWLPDLNRKKWPMSFSPLIRASISKLGMWNWQGLNGEWKREKLLQEYWDVEFLYQFEFLKRGNSTIERYFNWEEYSNNGVFLFLHDRIGYGQQGYQIPLIGRLSLAELYIDVFSRQIPFIRSSISNDNLDLPSLDKALFAYALSIPDGLKENKYANNLANTFAGAITLQEFNLTAVSFSQEDRASFERGIALLPFSNQPLLKKELLANPEKNRGIINLVIWLDQIINA